ncbi:ATP-binding cassette domain-containing protein [Pseudomonas sp. GX19020]|uniref:ATP-binding cassette domain-containing protein n=1 Tax=Pseudomonadota TaxID=1224 RepID=UPI00089D5C67|nr:MULTISPECIES: ATP-binding cassette domain-containing protein [Pseudomonadota]MCL4065768.1 ATP-binding cassette domain-containing protein [Pseudomonas sp. GX19020]SEC01598.1 dipeptide transport system ATP-binding protein [Rhodobacter sp. 24-YEA-8]
MSVVLEGRNITQEYHTGGGMFGASKTVQALKGVSFSVEKGKTLAIVGESGSGKSTLARIIALIDAPSGGDLLIEGQPVNIAVKRPDPVLRSKVQMVFQNPYGSLNPRQKIGSVLMEPLVINRPGIGAEERRALAEAMLVRVGLGPEHFNRFPHMFSGGQRQRIAIARALMLNPSLLVLDEPVSALDLSVQAQVLNLLADLQEEFGLTYVFVSHDLSVVRYIADDVMVISQGLAVEQGKREAVFANPTDAYTRQLFAATPVTDVEAIRARVAKRQAAREAAGAAR